MVSDSSNVLAVEHIGALHGYSSQMDHNLAQSTIFTILEIDPGGEATEVIHNC